MISICDKFGLDTFSRWFTGRRVSYLCFVGLTLCLLMIGASGCITDSNSNCEYPLRLRFCYIFNREDRDLIRDEIDYLRLYLFETYSGQLIASKEVNVSELDSENTLFWEAPSGRHTLVVWGFSKDGSDPVRFSINGSEKNYFSHFLSLQNLAAENNSAKEIPQSKQHLWHCCQTDILVNGDISSVYDIELRKISNDVNIHLYLDGISFNSLSFCKLSATNGKYNASGQVSATVPTLYVPKSGSYEIPLGYNEAEQHQFTILGLWASDDSHLSLSLPGMEEPLYEGSLTELIDRLPYLDYALDDIFNLDFYVSKSTDGNLNVAVRVNDWDIVSYRVSLK